MIRIARAVRRGLLLVVVGLNIGGCGYSLAGRGNALPPSVRIIGVPQFVNQTSTAEMDRVLTDAVRAEFQSKGRYRVIPEADGADAVLTATVTSVRLEPLAINEDQQVSSYTIITTASVEFRDVAANRVVWSNRSFQSRDEYELTTATADQKNDPRAFFAQEGQALERLSRGFARSIVTSILEAF